jgi:hypothetical protein
MLGRWDRLVVFALALVGVLTVAGSALAVGGNPAVRSVTDDLGSYASLVGIVLPALVALLQRDGWGSAVNGAIFGFACVVASVVYGWIKFGGDFSWAHWESTLLAVVVWGLATYHLFWKPSTLSTKLRALPLPPPSSADGKK